MGLDENLPTFHINADGRGSKTEIPYLYTRGGHNPEPAYSLKHPDPASPTGQNCYAAALFDAYSPDILYGEVLIQPRWTQPTLSTEEIRRNGGLPPPPEPILPTTFTVQLYNPDLQIDVTRENSTFGGTHYDFGVPQDSFRLPSSSSLDREQHNPAASQTTPKIVFSFRRESKLSKNMVLYMQGKSTDVVHKKKSKEPDISVALFKSLRELTIYEPNLYRIEMEDPKGLEVTILLVATVIKDVYFGALRQAFNVHDEAGRARKSSASSTGRKASDPNTVLRRTSQPSPQQPAMMSGALSSATQSHNPTPAPSLSAGAFGLYAHPSHNPAYKPTTQSHAEPITDPRTQWAINNETARLRAQSEAEARESQRQADLRRKEQARKEEDERKRLLKQLEAEEKEQRRKEREVEKETERLRKIYGDQNDLRGGGSGRQGAQSAPVKQSPFPARPTQTPHVAQQAPPKTMGIPPAQHRPSYSQQRVPPQMPPRPSPGQQGGGGGLIPGQGSSAFSAGQGLGNFLSGGKKSIMNLRGKSEESKLKGKRSSVW